MIARRLGLRVMLLERGRHPRFAIGESASPLAGILIEQLADRYDLPRLRPLAAFGTWQRTYPHVVCGLKRGFTYFKHEAGRRYRAAGDRSNQLLVAASPNDELSDTHWLRADVDHFLVREAVALGVEYLDHVELERVDWQPDGDPRAGRRAARDSSLRVRARFVVDATGPRGFLSRALASTIAASTAIRRRRRSSRTSPASRAATRCPTSIRGRGGSTTSDSSRFAIPSTPVSGGRCRAAPRVRRRLDVGAAVRQRRHQRGRRREDWLAEDLRLADGEPAWQRLLARFPSIAAQFADARPIRPFTWMPRLAYRAAAGGGRAMGDAAVGGGVRRSAVLDRHSADAARHRASGRILRAGLAQSGLKTRLDGDGGSGRSSDAATLQRATLADADRTARFVAGSYAGFRQFRRSRPTRCSISPPPVTARWRGGSASPRTPARLSLRRQRGIRRLRWSGCHRPQRGTVDAGRYEREVAAAVADWNVAGSLRS